MNLILWRELDQLEAFTFATEFRPVYEYDQEIGAFTKQQMVSGEGLPIWEASALVRVGYAGIPDRVRIRVVASTAPVVEVMAI